MNTPHHHTTRKITLTLLTIAATLIMAIAGVTAAAHAAAPPVKLTLSNHITNGFAYPVGVAVGNDLASPEYGDIYVADRINHRVQVLSGSGAFVEMFGAEVDATTKENICTALSHNSCQAGVEGAVAGQFGHPESIAVDPSSGDVYVAEYVFANGEYGLRVQEFTAEGKFVLEIGRAVNVTKGKEPAASEAEKNLCREVEVEKGTECGGPAQEIVGGSEDGALNFGQNQGDLLAVGGKEDLLYVGDEHRVQEFSAATGKWVGEIPLTSISNERESEVRALALDQETGDIYLNYAGPSMNSNRIREFDPGDSEELASFAVNPRTAGKEVTVGGMALNPSGRLAVIAREHGKPLSEAFFGSLYDATSGRRVAEFANPRGASPDGIGFDSVGDLYVVAFDEVGEVLAYTPNPIGELVVSGFGCAPGVESDSSVTFACTLKGEVNPESVAGTEALFEYGRTPALGEKTPIEKIGASEPIHAVVSARPNETYYYRLAGFDSNDLPPEEPFSSEQASLSTQTVAPHIVGAPSTPAVRPSSAVLLSELNPENAATEYSFEYAQGEHALAACTAGVRHMGCPGVQSTPLGEAAVYGSIGAKAEVTGLQPSTSYRYRLFAEDESRINHGERFQAIGPEAAFTTEPTPLPSAQTGGYSAVSATGARISGAVNPDGVPAGYAFELGVYNGADTQYTIVYSAAAGSGSVPVEESLPLTGLQPGTTYAYRIDVSSGYIANEAHALQGEPVTFTTAGVPAVLVSPVSLALLPVPVVAFPVEAASSGSSTKKGLTRAQKLAAALKTCKRDRSKSKRTKCERTARKTYGSRGHG
jgi:hypothetical protein